MAFVCMTGDEVVTSLKQVDGSCDATFEYMESLKEYLSRPNVIVLIEQQMSRNGRAYALQHQMTMYCVCHGLAVEVVSSRLKTPRGLSYAQRKRYAVDVARQHNIPLGDGKVDDIADAFVQILAFKNKRA